MEDLELSAEEVAELTADTPEDLMPMDAHEVKLDGDKIATDQKYKFNAEGREVEANLDQLLKYAQQGYGAANKIGELKKQLEERQVPEEFEQYRAVDEWAKSNAEKWAAIQAQINQSQKPQPEVPEYLAPLMDELKGLREFKEQLLSERQQTKVANEDKVLDDEIKSIRDQYSDLDFDLPDDNGQTLEWKVLKHAADNGITSFKTAFRDFNHDRLMKLAEEKGKMAVIEERRKRNKLGLLEAAPSLKADDNPNYNPRTASDSENYEAALRELGIA